MTAISAFRKAYTHSDALDLWDDFSSWEGRKLRYAVYWAFYENSAFDDVNLFADSLKTQYGLYRHTRGIYNPAYRLAEFWRTHLLGGALDPEAGDGKREPSAIPLIDASDDLRRAVARVWRWSNWQTHKDVLTLYGPVYGDVAIRVMDDVRRRRVYLSVVNPSTLRDVTLDERGNVKGYIIEESRIDPERTRRPGEKPQTVVYREECERKGEDVVFHTYRGNSPYAWDGNPEQWSEPYGFVPLVLVQHNNVGKYWGWSELHAGRVKLNEVNDLASLLHDQIRKTVNILWLFAGVQRQERSTQVPRSNASTSSPGQGRQELDSLYAADPNARAHPLVAPLDITGALAAIAEMMNELEDDYPELLAGKHGDNFRDNGGRALRVMREPVETRVQMRRAGYDDGLVRAQQMAASIGGYRYAEAQTREEREPYRDFAPFTLDSYDRGELDHRIGKRAVFATDVFADIEQQQMTWNVVDVAVRAKADLRAVLDSLNVPNAARLANSEEQQLRMQVVRQLASGDSGQRLLTGGNGREMPTGGQNGGGDE